MSVWLSWTTRKPLPLSCCSCRIGLRSFSDTVTKATRSTSAARPPDRVSDGHVAHLHPVENRIMPGLHFVGEPCAAKAGILRKDPASTRVIPHSYVTSVSSGLPMLSYAPSAWVAVQIRSLPWFRVFVA